MGIVNEQIIKFYPIKARNAHVVIMNTCPDFFRNKIQHLAHGIILHCRNIQCSPQSHRQDQHKDQQVNTKLRYFFNNFAHSDFQQKYIIYLITKE